MPAGYDLLRKEAKLKNKSDDLIFQSSSLLKFPTSDKFTVYYYVPSGSRDFSNFAKEYLSIRNTRKKIIIRKNSLTISLAFSRVCEHFKDKI